jgi:tetratricopeptide (TPR) repeat protein
MPLQPPKHAAITRYHLIMALVVTVGALLFFPGLSGDFLFDDAINIVGNAALRLPSLDLAYLTEAALSNPASSGQRWLAMLSFALNEYWLGPLPAGYKIINVALHALSALALYGFLATYARLCQQFAPQQHESLMLLMAILAVAWWMLSPINLSPALYIVQRMTSLSALFCWLCLTAWLLFRLHLDRNARARALLWFMASFTAGGLAVSSKENGVLIPLYVLLIELILLRPLLPTTAYSVFFVRLFGGGLTLVVLLVSGWLLRNPDWLTHTYGLRDFTPTERVMTQGRVLWFYLVQTMVPRNDLLGFYQDAWPVSKGMLTPLTTLLSWLGWAVFLGAALRLRRYCPLACFGLLFFLAAHSMEASFLSLEMVHEHRNYLPSGGLVMAGTALLGRWLAGQPPRLKTLAGILTLAYLTAIVAVLANRVQIWSNPVDHALTEVTHHPDSARSQYQWARVLLMLSEQTGDRAYVAKAYEQFKATYTQFPDNRDALVGLIVISSRYDDYTQEAEQWRQHFLEGLGDSKLHPSLVGQLPLFLESCAKAEACYRAIDSINETFLANPHVSGPFRSSWLLKMAEFHSKQGDQVKAEALLQQSFASNPGNANMARILAVFYLQQGRLDEAEALLKPFDTRLRRLMHPSAAYFLDTIRTLKSEEALRPGTTPSPY